jgi:hypothetical protein
MPEGRLLFEENFEKGLGRWTLHGADSAVIRESGDPEHGRVLALIPQGDAYAIIDGSERWNGVRIQADVLFPTDEDSYLGVIYNFRQHGGRTDFGAVYLKGNDNYLQANPHRDFNVSRTLYPEFRAALSGTAAVRRGQWQPIAVEVVGRDCNVYVGDMEAPQLTFPAFELDSGAVGFQPRSVGAEAWIDNVRVSAIQRVSYAGPRRPNLKYETGPLLTRWEVHGPLARTDDEAARRPATRSWKPFSPDARGAVVTGRVVDFHGPKRVAYFRTGMTSAAARAAELEVSTVDDLALWVNGRFHWFIPRASAAWFDFFRNPAHAGQRIPIELRSGANELVFRVQGGVYASGGFYARVTAPS